MSQECDKNGLQNLIGRCRLGQGKARAARGCAKKVSTRQAPAGVFPDTGPDYQEAGVRQKQFRSKPVPAHKGIGR